MTPSDLHRIALTWAVTALILALVGCRPHVAVDCIVMGVGVINHGTAHPTCEETDTALGSITHQMYPVANTTALRMALRGMRLEWTDDKRALSHGGNITGLTSIVRMRVYYPGKIDRSALAHEIGHVAKIWVLGKGDMDPMHSDTDYWHHVDRITVGL